MSDDTPVVAMSATESRGMVIRREGFEEAPELERMARWLIEANAQLVPLGSFQIAYLWDHGDAPHNGKPCSWGKARLVPPWTQALAPYDACVTVLAKVWLALRERQREALLLHELLHLGVNEKGAIEIRPHDVEEFGYVAAKYGAWRPSLEQFGGQLQLGLAAGDGHS